MSRSLGRRIILKSRNLNHEADGWALFKAGHPCPPKPLSKGKEHAVWRGWQRARVAAQQGKKK